MGVIKQVVALHAAGLVSGATVAKAYELDKTFEPFATSLDRFVRRYQVELAAVQAEREPVLCRCCGRRVTNSDREPIHTFPCITRHARHQRGKGASRCHEYRNA